jgi:hypothetical protein
MATAGDQSVQIQLATPQPVIQMISFVTILQAAKLPLDTMTNGWV